MYLSGHRIELFNSIRRNCICTYIKPFGKVDMQKMAVAFGTTTAELEIEVAKLIGACCRVLQCVLRRSATCLSMT